MNEKIIHQFPLEELNVILGGIRERNIYTFTPSIQKPVTPDYSDELLEKAGLPRFEHESALMSFVRKLADSFGITRKHENLLLINYNRLARDVHRYFRNIEVDIHEVSKKIKDIYEFMDYFNNNPFVEELNKRIRSVQEKNGSFIVFNVPMDTGMDEFIVASLPDDFINSNIFIDSQGICVDNIQTFMPDGIHKYPYPFDLLPWQKLRRIYYKNIALLKTIEFEVRPHDYILPSSKYTITRHYQFSRKYDIYRGLIIPHP